MFYVRLFVIYLVFHINLSGRLLQHCLRHKKDIYFKSFMKATKYNKIHNIGFTIILSDGTNKAGKWKCCNILLRRIQVYDFNGKRYD